MVFFVIFTDNLSFADNKDGVYIFLTSVPQLDMERMDVTPKCTMHYCGKTIDLRHRFDQHHHKDDLKGFNPLYIAVAYCNDETEITELESKLLDTFHFEFNDPSTNKGTNSKPIKSGKAFNALADKRLFPSKNDKLVGDWIALFPD